MDSIVASRFARFNERLCVAIEHGRDNDFPAENDFFACVETIMSDTATTNYIWFGIV
jgi:hypothetical protein